MFFIIQQDERPQGYVHLSTSTQWESWLANNIPAGLHDQVKRRLMSNLKHLLVGLEIKAALLEPHVSRGPGDPSVLFEPYFQSLILEFCVGAFSVLEGLGASHQLRRIGQDGIDSPKVHRNDWRPALCSVYDADGDQGLEADVERTLSVRDKLHQDKLGSREDIDWNLISFHDAFVPARRAIRTVLRFDLGRVPPSSNLHIENVD